MPREANHYLSLLFPLESQRNQVSLHLTTNPLPPCNQHNNGISGMPTCVFNKEQLMAINRIIQLTRLQDTSPNPDTNPIGTNPNVNTNTDPNNTRDAPPLPPVPLQIPPFVLFGPPGTGKTSTLIASIINLCEQFPHKRILACAPSDAAADLIAMRLITYFESQSKQNSNTNTNSTGTGATGQKKLFRLNWWQRIKASIPIQLLPYCYENDGLFDIPLDGNYVVNLGAYQVIVCTCGTVGSLLYSDSINTKPITFDVVIIDEASQALEPEVVIPVSLCRPGGVVVIAGDVNQLGPVTRTPIIKYCGVSSLQSRLLKLPYYASCLPNPNTNPNTNKLTVTMTMT